MSAGWKGRDWGSRRDEGAWRGGDGKGKAGASWRGGGKGEGKDGGKQGGGKGRGKQNAGPGGQKPTDDPDFVRWTEGMRLEGSPTGVSYVVDAYVASGTFSRVFRVCAEPSSEPARTGKRRWAPAGGGAAAGSSAGGGGTASAEGTVYAAKIMRKHDSYIQYTSNAEKEGELLQRLEKAQSSSGRELLTMRCVDSFATKDTAGVEYWCLILEWLDASLFDLVRANGNQGLHLSMVRAMLAQLLEQLRALQEHDCTHTDIKHKNCCLADTEHYMAPAGSGGRPSLILTRPAAKFIDYGNAVFEGEEKVHPIHTKQFRAPEVLLNAAGGWGPPSDTWTLGVTVAFLVSGQLIFNSHDPGELVNLMVEALGPFPERLLSSAKDGRLRRAAEAAAQRCSSAQARLGERLGLGGAAPNSPEGRCVDLLQRMLAPDPAERISPAEALRHPFVAAEDPPVPPCPANAELRSLPATGGGGGGRGKGGGRKGG